MVGCKSVLLGFLQEGLLFRIVIAHFCAFCVLRLLTCFWGLSFHLLTRDIRFGKERIFFSTALGCGAKADNLKRAVVAWNRLVVFQAAYRSNLGGHFSCLISICDSVLFFVPSYCGGCSFCLSCLFFILSSPPSNLTVFSKRCFQIPHLRLRQKYLADPDHPLNTPLWKTLLRKHPLFPLGQKRQFCPLKKAVCGTVAVFLGFIFGSSVVVLFLLLIIIHGLLLLLLVLLLLWLLL